jgi:hypothetical protein
MAIEYAYEKFSCAVTSLVSSEESLQLRLAHAYSHNVTLVGEQDVTPQIWDRLVSLRHDLTAQQREGKEEGIMASVRRMDEITVRRLLNEIVSIYDQIVAECHTARTRRIRIAAGT